MLIYANEDNFDKVVSSKKKCLVDFYASWCGPCQMIGAELEKISKEEVDFDIIKVDIDNNRNLASKYRVQVVPTMYILVDGKAAKMMTGYMNKSQILENMSKF